MDVDGTLLDFAKHPDDVAVDARLHGDLASMCTRLGGAVALLSGRPLSQLDDLFDWHDHAAASTGCRVPFCEGCRLKFPNLPSFELTPVQWCGLPLGRCH